jgi:hypothetical protein
LPAHYSPHSFRATGITNFLENDGLLKPRSALPATPTAGQRSFMIAGVRRSSSRIWKGFAIEDKLL